MAAKLYGGAYLTSFVDAILEKLSPILKDDSFVLRNKLLGRLEKCLYDVGAVLDDAEQKQFTDKRVKNWLDDLQDALYMADDLLDEISTEAAIASTQRRDPGNSSSWLRRVDSCIDDTSNMENIVSRLESVVAKKNYHRLKECAKVDMSSWRTPSTSLVVYSDIFGRDKDKEKIIKLLLDDTCPAESPVTVIPIVGMGGIGKTTLAQLVYSDAQVVKNFDTRVWVCVAENSNPVHVTRTIIGTIDSYPCTMDNFDFLQTDLKKKLTGKTFLVVLDDVWNDQRDTWEDFLRPFRYGNNGSKILLTTRSEKVASVFAAPNQHYQLSLLSDEDCWSVFLKHSSVSTNSEQYATLEPIGRKIVEKCKGLPLAVKTLGGLLRNEYNVGRWKNILESEIWELPENESKIIPALRVSYHYLPSHLKWCFVYCSVFPEDYEFDKDELVLLWMAEDLLQLMGNDSLEKIGCAYFDELVARSFFQLSSADDELFVMHDLMHDLATFIAGKFFFRVDKFGNPHMADSKTRHLSYNRDPISGFLEAYNGAIYMRTFLRVDVQSNDIECDFWLQRLKCLRVLSFRGFKILSLPDSIGELIHLRYLDLSHTSIVTLPESLCKLYNLQTLKLRDCEKLEMLPSSIQELVNLRHLDIKGAYCLKEMPKGMSKLKHLNFLSGYIVGKQEENGIRELGSLDNLHGSLCISNLKNVNNSREALAAKMDNKKHINILELKWIRDDDDDDDDDADDDDADDVNFQKERNILEELQPHRNLKELSIDGYRGEIFPDWLGLSCYSNITELSMYRCKNCRQLPSLGQLPSLQHLKIYRLDGLERIGGEFYNNAESSHQGTPFRSLETLEFCDMPCWREWHIPDGFDGFLKLKSLSIEDCPVLSGDLPAHLLALEELFISKCPEMDCLGEECLPPSLTTLWIGDCPKLERWITSKGLQSEGLIHLMLHQWNEVKSFPREGCLPASLEYLHLSSFSNLETLDYKGLHQLTSLQILITVCPKLENITQENLPASISKLFFWGPCPLKSKLEEMNDPRIQFETE